MSREFTIVDAPQRSPEWFSTRLGRVTGSKASCVLMAANTAGRNDYVLELALGRITGIADDQSYTSLEMQRGIDKEPFARMRAARGGHLIRETGFLTHNKLMIGTSLDGDSDDFKRIWEFKCPKSTTHVKYLKSGGAGLLKDYQPQLVHGAYLTSAEDIVIGSFDDRLPSSLDWVQYEIRASSLPIHEYEKALMQFLSEVADMEDELREMMAKSHVDQAPIAPITGRVAVQPDQPQASTLKRRTHSA